MSTLVSFTMPQSVLQRAASRNVVTYPPSWLFDFNTGDYILDGGGDVIDADGYQAWVQRCIKAILTQRYAYPIYSRQYGTHLIRALSYPNRDIAKSMLQREISEALLHDRGTGAIISFIITWVGDEVSYTVVLSPKIPAGRTVSIVVSADGSVVTR
jgi:hypothetical protein